MFPKYLESHSSVSCVFQYLLPHILDNTGYYQTFLIFTNTKGIKAKI